MNTIKEKWLPPGSKCDLCQRPKKEGEYWGDIHCYMFTFNFCTECERERQTECDKVWSEYVYNHIQKVREYWDTHPEALAEHNRKTAEYRKTLDVDGYPKEFSRTHWQRFRNFIWRIMGYSMYDKNGYLSPGNWGR